MTTLRRFWALIKFFRRVGGVQGAKQIARDSPKYVLLLRRLLADNRVPASAKAALLGAGAFAVSPLNIPCYIPVLGALDDIGIAMIAWSYFEKKVPKAIMAEHCAALGLTGDALA